MSLMGVFIPIFLYQLGYSLTNISMYLVWCGVFWVALIYPTMRGIARFGPNRVMAVSSVVSLVFFAQLATFSQQRWPLWSIAISWGIMVATYWFPLRVSFAAAVNPDRQGMQISWSSALILATGGLAPFIGGVIAEVAGISAIYIVGFTLMLLAAGPLFMTPDIARPRRFSMRTIPIRRYLGSYLANISYTTDDVVFYFWPLLIFLVVPSYVGVGALSSVIVLSSIVVSLYVGRRLAHQEPARYLRQGSWLLGITNAVRSAATAASHVFALNLLSGISHSLLDTPFFSRYYERGRGEQGFRFIFAMQVASAIGWIVFSLIALAISTLAGTDKQALAAILIAAVPFSFLIAKIR